MGPRIARLMLAVTAALLAVLSVSAVASGTEPLHARPATVLDGFGFDHLPTGLGGSTDFTYHFSGVGFASRTWESRVADGWRVDLDIDVMRGRRLTSGAALHDWFLHYEDRQPAVPYIRTSVHGHAAWLARDEVFWLQEPGVAVAMQVDGSRWSTAEVARTGWSAHPVG